MQIVNRQVKGTVITKTDGSVVRLPTVIEETGVDAAGTEMFVQEGHLVTTLDGRPQVVTPENPVYSCEACTTGPWSKDAIQYCAHPRHRSVLCRPCSRHVDDLVFCRQHYWRHLVWKGLRWLLQTN